MQRELSYVSMCVCVGGCLRDENGNCFLFVAILVSIRLVDSLFFFSSLNDGFFVNHWDFPVSIVDLKLILEQSFFLLSFSFSLCLFFLSLCFFLSLSRAMCLCISSSLFFLIPPSLFFSLYLLFPSFRFSLSLCLRIYISLLKFNDQENQLSNLSPQETECQNRMHQDLQTELEKSNSFLCPP